MTTFRAASDKAFATLMNLWNEARTFQCGGGCFWMGGNTFHAALDYLISTEQPDKVDLIQTAVKFFEDRIPKTPPEKWVEDGIWIDDYGWWGIALMRAYNNPSLGYDEQMRQKLAEHAQNCWNAMKYGWVDTPLSPSVPITGGVANTNRGGSLAGRNCVTNEVYWLLSHYLSVAFGPRYLDPSTNAANWFAMGKQQGVLFNGSGFVLERFRGVGNGFLNPEWSWLAGRSGSVYVRL